MCTPTELQISLAESPVNLGFVTAYARADNFVLDEK
jgi:hypothetical protein